MKVTALALCLPLVLVAPGCSRRSPSAEAPVAAAVDNGAATLSPGKLAVRIGDGGAGFAACGTSARVINLSPAGQAYLPVRAAPFAEADEVARLDNGARLYACTRSMDQQWQGVVIPPADAPDDDCGVSAPVAQERDYAGPCVSGWVASDFVRLGAN